MNARIRSIRDEQLRLSASFGDSTVPPFNSIDMGAVKLYPLGTTGSPCFYSPDTIVHVICIPGIILSSQARTGRCALYHKLGQHAQIIPAVPTGEFCPRNNSKEAVWEWLSEGDMTVVPPHIKRGVVMVSCSKFGEFQHALMEVKRLHPAVKVITVVRGIVQWAYSYYASGCVQDFDGDCPDESETDVWEYSNEGDGADADDDDGIPDDGDGFEDGGRSSNAWKRNRSPKLFDELLHSEPKLAYFPRLRRPLSLFRPALESIISIMSKEQVLIVKQEDLASRGRTTLNAIAAYVGVDAWFPEQAYALVCAMRDGKKRFTWAEEKSGDDGEGGLEMGGGEFGTVVGNTVLEESRTVLNGAWEGECEWLRDFVGLQYPGC